MQNKIDEIIPNGSWRFDEKVAAVFDDMLQRSIPQYNVMREACFDLACKFRQMNTDIVDLGCSRGNAIAGLIDKYGSTNHYVGVDISDAMLNASESRFKPLIESGIVSIQKIDLRQSYPWVASSVTLCVLTLQFTPIEYRQKILSRIYEGTVDGGALILVEKVIGNGQLIDDTMIDLYYALKKQNGYSYEQIESKRKSLEGALVPLTAQWNEKLLSSSGFSHVDCFWRWMNFAGWVAVKNKKV